MYREIGDRALGEKNVAMAALNYRRAATAAPNSQDGQAAVQAIAVFQEDATAQLGEVDELVAAQEFDRAVGTLRGLWQDYSALPIAPKIEQARRRALRLKEAAGSRVAKMQGRAKTPPAAQAATDDRTVALAQLRDPAGAAAAQRPALPAVLKLAERMER